jgi:predicted transcriptional regulator
MDLAIKNKKDELIQWLSSLEDKNMIDKIFELKEAEKTDWWNSISKAEKESIEEGISEADKGNMKPHSEAKKIYGRWL